MRKFQYSSNEDIVNVTVNTVNFKNGVINNLTAYLRIDLENFKVFSHNLRFGRLK